MKQAIDLKDLLAAPQAMQGQTLTLQGWVRNHRKQKTFGFINFYDGTCPGDIQVVYDEAMPDFAAVSRYYLGSAVEVEGKLLPSQGGKGGYEIQAARITLLGGSTEDYPLQPKKHSLEYLRQIGHLRPRTRLFQAVFRVRSIAAYAIHRYFNERNYLYVHTPLITANDGEGAGETFRVTTIDYSKVQGEIDYSQDFFGKETCLAVTGQLEGEIFAMAFKRIYTFGPTFRAENSNTKTHAAEFWMIEPEIAFCDLDGLMDIEEEFIKDIVGYVLKHAAAELEFLDTYCGGGLLDKLTALVTAEMVRVDYRDAIKILKEADAGFLIPPVMGGDLAREHEKYLTDVHFKSPVFVYNWPQEIKAFYMRDNGDGTVAAVDLLVPAAGELTGGSQREERMDVLTARMDKLGVPKEELDWYIELRKYGGCVHAGFGMGFERLLIYLTGVENIRDVLPFPRTPGNCEF